MAGSSSPGRCRSAARRSTSRTDGIEARARQVFRNLETVLRGIGLELGDVVQARVYLARFERDYGGMNAAYAPLLHARAPACAHLHRRDLRSRRARCVEIDFVARRPERERP